MDFDHLFLDRKAPIHEYRGDLPHWSQDKKLVFLTFHLIDSMPMVLLDNLKLEKKQWLSTHPEPWTAEDRAYYIYRFSNYVDRWLDSGQGEGLLRIPEIARLVENALMYFDMKRYDVHSFVIMPNHVHILVEICEGEAVEKIYKSWKKYLTEEMNKMLCRKQKYWPREPWDRIIRSQEHYLNVLNYIEKNYKQGGVIYHDYTIYGKEEKPQ